MSTIDWRRDFPPMMKPEHLVGLYPFTVGTIKKYAQTRNPKVPTPAMSKPLAFRRDDVKRHWERLEA